MQNWYTLEENIYYADGSLRDILIQNTTLEDWAYWIDLINKNYEVEFFNGEQGVKESQINKERVYEYLTGNSSIGNSATIRFQNFNAVCHFFTTSEIENDILPNAIKSIEDHNTLVNYMIDVSKTLSKQVLLTAENQPDVILLRVNGDEIKDVIS